MIRVRVPDAAVSRLAAAARTADPTSRDRVRIVLMAHTGRPHRGIAADLGVTPRTAQRRLNAYLTDGPDGSRPRKAQGGAGAIPAPRAEEVKRRVIDGPARQGLGRANWTHEELADHLRKVKGPAPPEPRRGGPAPGSGSARPGRRTGSRVPTRPSRRRPGGSWRPSKKADAGEVVRLSQDEARVRRVPTPTATPGVKGHRPVIGTRDDEGVVLVLAALNVVSGSSPTNTLARVRARNRRTGASKTRRMRRAFAAHPRHVGRVYPAAERARVVRILGPAPWHRGKAIDAAWAAAPHPERYRRPSYSPSRNVVERFREAPRRRASHNRRFDTVADLERSVRNSLRYFPTVRAKVRSLARGCYPTPANQTPSPGT